MLQPVDRREAGAPQIPGTRRCFAPHGSGSADCPPRAAASASRDLALGHGVDLGRADKPVMRPLGWRDASSAAGHRLAQQSVAAGGSRSYCTEWPSWCSTAPSGTCPTAPPGCRAPPIHPPSWVAVRRGRRSWSRRSSGSSWAATRTMFGCIGTYPEDRHELVERALPEPRASEFLELPFQPGSWPRMAVDIDEARASASDPCRRITLRPFPSSAGDMDKSVPRDRENRPFQLAWNSPPRHRRGCSRSP